MKIIHIKKMAEGFEVVCKEGNLIESFWYNRTDIKNKDDLIEKVKRDLINEETGSDELYNELLKAVGTKLK